MNSDRLVTAATLTLTFSDGSSDTIRLKEVDVFERVLDIKELPSEAGFKKWAPSGSETWKLHGTMVTK